MRYLYKVTYLNEKGNIEELKIVVKNIEDMFFDLEKDINKEHIKSIEEVEEIKQIIHQAIFH